MSLINRINFVIQKIRQTKTMFDFVKNLEIVEQACKQFMKSHQTYYNFPSEIIPQVGKYHNLRIESHEVVTSVFVNRQKIENKIKYHLINNTNNLQNCIVYLHGLSSYSTQGKFLIPYLGDNLSLCIYDSRGHGKNSAQYVTYGLLESEDLIQLLAALLEKGFKNIILWGRSMGAVTCLRVMQKFKDNPVINSIKYIVADSPFSSFSMIATELVSKMVMFPTFISGMIADLFAAKINEKYGIDLKDINLQNLKSRAPVIFLYSSKDQMMGTQHIEAITNKFVGDKELIDTEVPHNEERPKWVIQKAINIIRQLFTIRPSQRRSYDGKKRGLSITRVCSNKYLSMVTPTCIEKNTGKTIKMIPPLNIQRRIKGKNSVRNQSKENVPNIKKSTVAQTINKYCSVELNTKLCKSTANRFKTLTKSRFAFDQSM